ncbi:MAG: hypothetical protein IJR68_12925 [Fretibacterium sp.]|nr:hypothetical protein [Fretibacterium sp.]MBR0179051.1 hypothetical protein [Bacillota bacterium]
MNISVKEKKAEALARMKELGIFAETIRQFEKDNKISISEPPFGAFYWIEGKDLERVREFERSYNALVFIAIRSYTSIGELDSFLFVSDYYDDWVVERRALKMGEAIAYVYNHDAPECSEIGCICVAPTVAAGLCRTW